MIFKADQYALHPMMPLIEIYPRLMKTTLFLISILIIFNFRFYLNALKVIKRKTWSIIILIFLSALLIRLFIIPHRHQVYYDEVEHINIAENILYSNSFCESFDGSNQESNICRLIPYPAGYHSFLSLMFYVFGDSEQTAFNTSAVIGSICVVLMFLLVYIQTRNTFLSLTASFIFNLVPAHLKFSGTTTICIFSVFFFILTMIFLELYIRRKKYSLFLLFLAALFYTIQIRAENFLSIPVFFFYLWIKSDRQLPLISKTRYLFSILFFAIMTLPLVQLIYYGINNFHSAGWNEPLLTKIGHLKDHFLPNLIFFANYNFNSLLFSIFCILGCIKLHLSDRKQLSYYGSFFLLFLLFYSGYHIGRFWEGDTTRYSLILYIPLTIFCINGLALFLDKINFRRAFFIPSMAVFFLISLLPVKDFIFSKSKHDSEYDFILSMKDKLPADVYIISYSPALIISTIHKKSLTPNEFIDNYLKRVPEPSATEPSALNEAITNNGPANNALKIAEQYMPKVQNRIILFKGFSWHRREKESREIEEKLKEYYTFELIRENYGYSFFNLILKNKNNPQ